ncbi:MAG: ATP-binding protein, partial [Candidatus Competibacterales bacterium]
VALTPDRRPSLVARLAPSLGVGVLGGALGLLAAQGLVLRWSLTPLRQVAREIQDIEAGRQLTLAGHYPAELQPLTRNLNQLVSRSRDHLERYRNTLGDLAHSLKTPLAVLGSSLETGADDLKHTVREQVVRMNQTVDYQLQRAAAAGRIALTAPVPVSAAAQQIVHSLAKVYSDKGLDFQWQVADELVFNGDRGDLLEVLGNLMDNACKWAAKTVRLRAWPLATSGDVVLVVEDDGPGIPDHRRATILQRGVRADPHTAGHGIGLAVVRELVEDIYRGQLTIDDSPLGGARIRAVLAMDP